MLANVVDIFVIAESNITAGGAAKPLRFFEAFRSGYLANFQHKILYVYQDHFPSGYVRDGWKADRCLIQISKLSIKLLNFLSDIYVPTCLCMDCHALLASHLMTYFSCMMQMRYLRRRQYFS